MHAEHLPLNRAFNSIDVFYLLTETKIIVNLSISRGRAAWATSATVSDTARTTLRRSAQPLIQRQGYHALYLSIRGIAIASAKHSRFACTARSHHE